MTEVDPNIPTSLSRAEVKQYLDKVRFENRTNSFSAWFDAELQMRSLSPEKQQILNEWFADDANAEFPKILGLSLDFTIVKMKRADRLYKNIWSEFKKQYPEIFQTILRKEKLSQQNYLPIFYKYQNKLIEIAKKEYNTEQIAQILAPDEEKLALADMQYRQPVVSLLNDVMNLILGPLSDQLGLSAEEREKLHTELWR